MSSIRLRFLALALLALASPFGVQAGGSPSSLGCLLASASGGDSDACWKACLADDNGSGTCARRCGTSDEIGAQDCWNACTSADNESDVCAPRCGIQTNSGSQSCWLECTEENNESDVCAPRCGVTTPAGSQACWNQCHGNENEDSATCSARCGTER